MMQRTEKKDQNKGITAISVQGFKSLANESRIEIRPLTISGWREQFWQIEYYATPIADEADP